MADTLQTVQWSLGADGHRSGYLWLPGGHESPDEVLEESIRRLGLEQPMRSAFPATDPHWYGYWIDSPLNAAQCALLRDVFAEAARAVPRYREYVEDFVRALTDAAETGEGLRVELSTPGHVDFGMVTTFVHCPRCKAEGLVERWQDAYPVDVLECLVCGHSYSPAATYSCERALFAETVRCRSCGAEHRVKDFSDDEIQALEDRQTFEELTEELGWLRRVEEFYERFPDLEGKIRPRFWSVLESRDPEVLDALFAGVPLGEFGLPEGDEAYLQRAEPWSQQDREVIDYLRQHSFSLPQRMEFVQETVERLGYQLFQTAPVRCPGCGGHLT